MRQSKVKEIRRACRTIFSDSPEVSYRTVNKQGTVILDMCIKKAVKQTKQQLKRDKVCVP